MKKRVIASILAAAMVMSSLAACGNNDSAAASGSSASGTSSASSESGSSEGSGVITDNFANVDTNGTTVTFWRQRRGNGLSGKQIQ